MPLDTPGEKSAKIVESENGVFEKAGPRMVSSSGDAKSGKLWETRESEYEKERELRT